MTATEIAPPQAVQHVGEDASNEFRRRVARVEPATLRTYTPTLAVIAKAAGSYVWTADGRKLADFSSGVLVANLGHNPTPWWRRMFDYLGLGAIEDGGEFAAAAPLTAYNAVSELEVAACERLLANMQAQPGGSRMEQVMWAASGSEAVQKSLWAAIARRPGENVILATRKGFHGKKGLAGAVTGDESDGDRDARVRFIGLPMEECVDVAARRRPIDLTRYEAELDALWEELGSRICCLITEPYLGGGGSFHPHPQYMQMLERFCRERDVVFILDEIQSNFGRTGPMYAYTHYGLAPDIVCLGKGLGNGVAVSAAVGRADLFATLEYGEGSDTFSGNPLAAAAVLATLDEFESGDVLERGQELAAALEEGLLRLKETGAIVNVRGEGCVWGIECAAIGETSAADVANAAVLDCYLGDEQGRAVHLLGPLAGRVLRVSPPLTMPIDEARQYLGVMHGLLAQLKDRLA